MLYFLLRAFSAEAILRMNLLLLLLTLTLLFLFLFFLLFLLFNFCQICPVSKDLCSGKIFLRPYKLELSWSRFIFIVGGKIFYAVISLKLQHWNCISSSIYGGRNKILSTINPKLNNNEVHKILVILITISSFASLFSIGWFTLEAANANELLQNNLWLRLLTNFLSFSPISFSLFCVWLYLSHDAVLEKLADSQHIGRIIKKLYIGRQSWDGRKSDLEEHSIKWKMFVILGCFGFQPAFSLFQKKTVKSEYERYFFSLVLLNKVVLF